MWIQVILSFLNKNKPSKRGKNIFTLAKANYVRFLDKNTKTCHSKKCYNAKKSFKPFQKVNFWWLKICDKNIACDCVRTNNGKRPHTNNVFQLHFVA